MNNEKPTRTRVATHIESLPRSGIRDFFDLVQSMDDVISLGVGEPDFVTPWCIRKAVIEGLEQGHTSYTSNLGMPSVREAICRYVEREFSVSYNPERECIITVGVSEALDLILRAILEPGDELIYHEPCYVSYAACTRMAHAIPVPVITKASNGFKLEADAVEEKITAKTKAILLNFPTNPTGADLSYAEKERLAALAVRHDLLVITDEIYSELTYGERTKSIAAFPGMWERTVFLHGFSKAYAMTGFRIGFGCAPHDLVEAMMKIHQYSMLCASIIGQEAALEALRSGYPEMIAMREEYRKRRNLIVKRLNELQLPCNMPDGAFYVLPDIRSTGLSSQDFAKRLLLEERVAVVSGTAFGPSGEGHVRCAYAKDIADIETAMDRMQRFVSRVR